MKIKCLFFLLLVVSIWNLYGTEKIDSTRFAIIIASYNNEKYCKSNLLSALYQDYSNFYIIFINDYSNDNTLDIVKKNLKQSNLSNLVTVINNQERQGAAYNYYNAIHNHTQDEDVIVILDGDDALANPNILTTLNTAYTNLEKEIWMTYGQFRNRKSGHIGFCAQMPSSVIEKHKFRQHRHIPSHLKTFKSWLFKKIKKEDLMYKGKFLPMTWDLAAMIPMIEMAKNHYKFIPTTLVIYNDMNPLSDHKVNKELQHELDVYIRSNPAYEVFEK